MPCWWSSGLKSPLLEAPNNTILVTLIDDFLRVGGDVTTSTSSFGNSWRIPDDGSVSIELGGGTWGISLTPHASCAKQ